MRRLKTVALRRTTPWLEEVEQSLSGGDIANNNLDVFPTKDIRRIITQHLEKRKISANSPDCDAYLKRVLEERNFNNGTLRLGTTVAFLPYLTSKAARSVFHANPEFQSDINNNIQVDLQQSPNFVFQDFVDVRLFANVIQLAYEANPAAATLAEAEAAKALLNLRTNDLDLLSQSLHAHYLAWVKLPEVHLLTHKGIRRIVRRACTQFAERLEKLEKRGRYHAAWVDVKWLIDILTESNQPGRHAELGIEPSSRPARGIDFRQPGTLHEDVHELPVPEQSITSTRSTNQRQSSPFEATVRSFTNPPIGREGIARANATPGAALERRINYDSSHMPRRRPVGVQHLVHERFAHSPPAAQIARLLDTEMPTWRTWATWQPNIARLKSWDGLDPPFLRELHDLLALEGRDLSGSGKGTQFEHLRLHDQNGASAIQHGSVRLDASTTDVRAALDRLYAALAIAQKHGNMGVKLYITLASRAPESMLVTDIFESLPSRLKDRALQALVDLFEPSQPLDRIDTIIELCDVMEGNDTLGELLSSRLLKAFHNSIAAAQKDLAYQIRKGGVGQNRGLRIARLMLKISTTTSFEGILEPAELMHMRQLPPLDTFECIFQYRDKVASSNATSLVDDPTTPYLLGCLAGGEDMGPLSPTIIASMVKFYTRKADVGRQDVAFALLRRTELEETTMEGCLSTLHDLPNWFVKGITSVLKANSDAALEGFAKLLVILEEHDKKLLYTHWLQLWASSIAKAPASFLTDIASSVPLSQWLKWIEHVEKLISLLDESSVAKGRLVGVVEWTQEIRANHQTALTRLSSPLIRPLALSWLLTRRSSSGLRLLRLVEGRVDNDLLTIQNLVIEQCAENGTNASSVCEELQILCSATDASAAASKRIIDEIKNAPQDVALTIAASFMASNEFSPSEKDLFRLVINRLGLRALDTPNIDGTLKILASRYDQLLSDAHDLEGIKAELIRRRPEVAKDFMKALGHQSNGWTNRHSHQGGIPNRLLDVIDQGEGGWFELMFPTMQMRPLRQRALGIPPHTKFIALRLRQNHDTDATEFCIHLGSEVAPASRHTHVPCQIQPSKPPPDDTACSVAPCRLVYALYRHLWRSHASPLSLEQIYDAVSAYLVKQSFPCPCCGYVSQGNTIRGITCSKKCQATLQNADISVRLTELMFDPEVVDLLLTCTFAANDSSPANSGPRRTASASSSAGLDLLPGCPLTGSRLRRALARFTTLSCSTGDMLYDLVETVGKDAVALLDWSLSSYEGFVVSAQGSLRIPGLPQVEQFLLAQPPAQHGLAFLQHVQQSQSKIAFHGTTMDRLYRILKEGLVIASGTPLQAHGAAAGSGIYLAEEPATSVNYTQPVPSWTGSALHNVHVLLACEISGCHSSGGMYVVTEPTRVMVRYIFLYPTGFHPPAAKDIVPAIEISCAALRAGTL